MGLRLEQISTAFKTAFGETGINATAMASRVRPVFEVGNTVSAAVWALPAMQTMFPSDPVHYYLYGGGGGWYSDDGGWYTNDTEIGFDDAEFTNPNFDSGTSGGTTSGTVGVVSNVPQPGAATGETLARPRTRPPAAGTATSSPPAQAP